MVIPNTTQDKVELSPKHNVEKIKKLLSNFTRTNKEKEIDYKQRTSNSPTKKEENEQLKKPEKFFR